MPNKAPRPKKWSSATYRETNCRECGRPCFYYANGPKNKLHLCARHTYERERANADKNKIARDKKNVKS